MTPHQRTGTEASCDPLDVHQARMLVNAVPTPTLVANVVAGGFSVLAVDRLLRRFIAGTAHPAGPAPTEVLAVEHFGLLGSAITAATTAPYAQQRIEVPIGDEPQWFELTVTSVVSANGLTQVIVAGEDHTADHDLEQRQRRSTRRFEAMVANAPGLILLVDSAGRVLQSTPGVEQSVGMNARELRGRAIFEILHPDTLARAASIFNHILSQPAEPLHIADFRVGHTDGSYLWCEATATNLLHDDDVAAIVFNVHDITERRMAEHRLELLATSDPLTGLPNRRQLQQQLRNAFDVAAREATGVGLVLVDVDDFKLVNDGLGHDVGDSVIRSFADRLQALAGPNARVARIGGDEFAVLLEHLTDADLLERTADAVHEMLRSPFVVDKQEVYVRASVGTTRGQPSTSDAEALFRSADLALYRAKRNGRNQTVTFTAELQLEAEERLRTITALQRALREGRLRLAYQPVVRANGALVGAEALLRWEHDGHLLSPATFLDLAEDTGLILPIGSWVIEQACRDIGTLRATAPDLEWVSINLSSRQLLDQRLPLVLRRAIAANELEPGSLAIEVSDSTIANDPAARDMLASLGDVGVLLSLDDVTSDQNVLHKISDLALTAVKLDRPFVQQLDVDPEGRARTLAGAIMDLAAENGIDVVATGVETVAQMQILEELGCPMFQGFLYSEPLDVGSFLTRARRT